MKGISLQNPCEKPCRPQGVRVRRAFVLWGWLVAMSLVVGSLLPQSLSAEEDVSKLSEAQKRERVIELYKKQIPLLEQHIQRSPHGPRAAESMFRLGEAYFETAKFYQLSGQDSRVALFNQKATEVLEKLRQTHPHYERLDEALLVLANTYLEKNEVEKAGPVLAEIADRFPDSSIMEQASYLLGDFYFEQDRVAQARVFYEKATQLERTQNYAHYRLAWVAQREARPAVALEHFEKVLELSRTQSQKSFDYSLDAAREMVWPALQVYGPQKVIPYLREKIREPEHMKSALRSLSSGLMKKEEYRLASQVLEEMIKAFPRDPEQGEWLSSQLDAEEKLGNGEKIMSLVSQVSGEAKDSKALQSQVYSSAKKYHALAQAEKDPRFKKQHYVTAIAYYTAFLNLSDRGPKWYEVQFYLGEALYAQGQKEQSAEAYKQSVNAQHEKRLDAAWNWYLVREELAPGFQYQGKAYRAPTAADEAFIEAARQVAQMEELSLEKRRKASYQSARLVYQLNDYDRALPIFKALAERYPQTQEGKLSRELVLDIYNLKKDFRNIALYARKFQSHVDSASRSNLAVMEERALFKSLQDEEAQAKNLEAKAKAKAIKTVASRYMSFARSYPQSALVDSAIWAAIQLQATAASYEEDRQFQDLRGSFRLLMGSYPESTHRKDAVALMGQFLADMKPQIEILKSFSDFRDDWYRQMRALPAATSGPMGMLVYHLSDDTQKVALEKRFLRWPMNDLNREALAHGRVAELRKSHARVRSLKISNLKQLQKQTKQKLDALAQFEAEVKIFLEMGVSRLSVEALELLAVNYEDMAESIRRAPIPTNLEGENKEKYLAIIEDKAQEFEEKAKDTRKLAQEAKARV